MDAARSWPRPALPLLVLTVLAALACDPTRDGDAREHERGAGQESPSRSSVVVGLERTDELTRILTGRVGLLAHRASVDSLGRHAIDVLRALDVDVVRVFSPEHGLRGDAAAGEPVADDVDPTSGLPVVSLYGEQQKPSAASLADLDHLVVDLQDVGVRFYTYVSTLILCLEQAAASGVEVVVLDRPNPLGGERIAGPPSAPRDVVPARLVNMAPGPLVHGMTLAEIARLWSATRREPGELTVITMLGWQRNMAWPDTGRQWIPPSPNLRTAAAALSYPGVAMLEATNVSEGRGTKAPFQIIGAPWLDVDAVLEQLAAMSAESRDTESRDTESRDTERGVELHGFRLEPTSFTPHASSAALQPKYAGEQCQGLEITPLTASWSEADPWRLGLELLRALSAQRDFEWTAGGDQLTWLLGTPVVGDALRQQVSVDAMLEREAGAIRLWRATREPALLYR